MDSIPKRDGETIERAVGVLFADESLAELRAISPSGTQRGYYDDFDKLAHDAALVSEQPDTNVYVVLNRIKPELAHRVTNEIQFGQATKDQDIERRRWLLIDLDPCKPPGMSANQSEKQAALDRGREVQKWLSAQGWPAPVVSDSGNGVHLVYALDLENSPEVTTVINGVLRALDGRFSDEVVSIDQSVGNPSRIAKLAGSVARKGTHSEARPHRTSRLLHIPEYPEALSLEQLQAVAGPPPEPPPRPAPGTNGDAFDVPGLLRQHNIAFSHQPNYQAQGGLADLYELHECPWSSQHSTGPGGSCVMQFQSGATSFSCRHEHCQGRGWEDFKQHLGIGAGPTVDDLVFPPKPEDDLPELLRVELPRPELDRAAYHGAIGEFAALAGEHSEADSAAILMQALTCFGVVAGRAAHFTIAGGTHHFGKLFLAVCGRTSKGRKGLSLDIAVRFVTEAANEFPELLRGGLTTGEGLIQTVRDPAYGLDKKGQPVLTHPGVEDKRGLFVESEMATIFARLRREGNTLSQVLRDAWDDKVLAVTTRKDPLTATDSHLSLIAHITGEELREVLRPTDINNGLANRFLWCYSDRRQLLPRGGDLPRKYVASLADYLQGSVEYAQEPREIGMTQTAWELWDQFYHEIDGEQDDLVMEGLSSRAAPQIRRLALLYALSDCEPEVQEVHLQAARACFEYSRQTLSHIYVSGIDGEEAQAVLSQILARLKVGPASRTDLYNMFQRNLPGPKLKTILTAALMQGLVKRDWQETDGRRREIYSLPLNA